MHHGRHENCKGARTIWGILALGHWINIVMAVCIAKEQNNNKNSRDKSELITINWLLFDYRSDYMDFLLYFISYRR